MSLDDGDPTILEFHSDRGLDYQKDCNMENQIYYRRELILYQGWDLYVLLSLKIRLPLKAILRVFLNLLQASLSSLLLFPTFALVCPTTSSISVLLIQPMLHCKLTSH